MNRQIRQLMVVLALILLVSIVTQSASAHAVGALRLANERIGPYELSAWTAPDPMRAGDATRVALLVLVPADEGQTEQDFILNADVTVRISKAGNDTVVISEKADHIDPLSPFFYEVDVFLPEAGEWDFEVTIINGDETAVGNFSGEAISDSSVNWVLIAVAIAVVAAIVGYIIFKSRREAASEASAS